jgi:hypothetical protein
MTAITFEEAVTTHADVTPATFWSNTLEGWFPLAMHHEETGDVAQAEFYQELVDAALWLVPQLILPALAETV